MYECRGVLTVAIEAAVVDQQPQIRAQLSFVLEGVVTQNLIAKATGPGRVLAIEVMVPNAAIRNLIREDKVAQMYSSIQTGQQYGMQTLDQNLLDLVKRGLVTRQAAGSYAKNKEQFK